MSGTVRGEGPSGGGGLRAATAHTSPVPSAGYAAEGVWGAVTDGLATSDQLVPFQRSVTVCTGHLLTYLRTAIHLLT